MVSTQCVDLKSFEEGEVQGLKSLKTMVSTQCVDFNSFEVLVVHMSGFQGIECILLAWASGCGRYESANVGVSNKT